MEPFTGLVLSNDPGALSVSHKVLEEYGFLVKAFKTAPAADQATRCARLDLDVYDSDVDGALQLAVPNRLPGAPNMVFALVRGADPLAILGKRIPFMLQKPFSADLFARSLRAAFGVVLKERRTSFRHRVQVAPTYCALFYEQGRKDLPDTVVLDVSHTGLCLQTHERLVPGTKLALKLYLQEAKANVIIEGVVIWARENGRAGVKFTDMDPEAQQLLIDWLDSLNPASP